MNTPESLHDFFVHLLDQQQKQERVPSNDEIRNWAEKLICVMFPQLSTCVLTSMEEMQQAFSKLSNELEIMMGSTTACKAINRSELAGKFFKRVPEIYRLLNTDIEAIVAGDPAAHSAFEVVRAYPGFYALCFYRIAHELQLLNIPMIPRILTEMAHSKTGIDIHPAATIGEYFCIDHGTGIVIGETANIGNNVKIYQGVTLGALSVRKEMAFTKRHPTIEDHVVIYSGATILGGNTVIGHHSVIGGNVWLTESVQPGSLVSHQPEITVVEGKFLSTTL
ncbi:MAG: serine O-acetyltransferase [Flavitalea sp.]